MSTRGIEYLRRRGIAHEVVRYEHLRKGAEFAARAVGFDLARTVKTLVVSLGGGRHSLVLMPGDREAAMKKVAAAGGVKRAALADSATAQRLTGYLVGGISPFATRMRLPVLIERSLLPLDTVLINAGGRGVMIRMRPADIVAALEARAADLCAG